MSSSFVLLLNILKFMCTEFVKLKILSTGVSLHNSHLGGGFQTFECPEFLEFSKFLEAKKATPHGHVISP